MAIVTGTFTSAAPTADYYSVFDAPTGATIRLTATAVTNDVVYSLETN